MEDEVGGSINFLDLNSKGISSQFKFRVYRKSTQTGAITEAFSN